MSDVDHRQAADVAAALEDKSSFMGVPTGLIAASVMAAVLFFLTWGPLPAVFVFVGAFTVLKSLHRDDPKGAAVHMQRLRKSWDGYVFGSDVEPIRFYRK